MDTEFAAFITFIVVGFCVLIGGVAFIEYQFDERTAELFIECMEVADTNEQVIACNTRFHR